jgi:hypothetical protein
MNQLISKEIIIAPLNNWTYPKLQVDFTAFPEKEPEDLPDALRLVDIVGELPQKWCQLKGEELIDFLEKWTYIENSDEVRIPEAYKKGGKMAANPNNIKKLRVIAKEFLYKVGRHIVSGHFNLTTIPFPIKVMIPKSYLENVGCASTAFFPLYLNLAMKTADPVERFKMYIVASICYFYLTNSFAKPLNPILGETFNGYYEDGSQMFLEQISHHPPVSYLLYHGPQEAYKYWGPSMFSASAGLNSFTLSTKAWRMINFKDNNQTIHNTLPNESIGGTLLGTTVHETIGNMEFKDEENEIYCNIQFGKVKGKPSDYFSGVITVKDEPVSKVLGSYLGFIDIDGKRFFNHRYVEPFECKKVVSPLESDCHYRPDRALLSSGYYDEAQKHKESLEHIQRTDAKLRKQNKENSAEH